MASSKITQGKKTGWVVGITGLMGAGKTSAGQHLASAHGFKYLRYSLILGKALGVAKNKRALQEVGWKVMSRGFQGDLNRLLIGQIRGRGNYAVDGLRHPADYRSLKRRFGSKFFLVYIEAPQQKRFQRLLRKGRFKNMVEFRKADRHPVERRIPSLRPKANAIIHNDGSRRNLYSALDRMLEQLKGGRP